MEEMEGEVQAMPVEAKAAKRISFMAIAASPSLARAANLESAGFGNDENLVSAIASASLTSEEGGDDVLDAVAAALQRESQVDEVVQKRLLARAGYARKTLERSSKFLKDAARQRYQCTLSANLASRQLYDYIARQTQLAEEEEPAEEDGSLGFSEVGQSFARRLEQVLVPPSCAEDDPKCQALLAGSGRLMDLSKAIESVSRDLGHHQKTSPSASEILRMKESMGALVGTHGARDPWLATCEYNVLLRQALMANRERRGMLERMTELVERRLPGALHAAILAAEATMLPEGRYLAGMPDPEPSDRTSPVAEANQAGNSVDLLLEQRLAECAGALLEPSRRDLHKAGTLELQVASSSGPRAPASAWRAVTAVVTKGGNFCWFSDLIPGATGRGVDGLLVPEAVISMASLSVEPGEAPEFDLVELGGWRNRSKNRFKFRALDVEDSVDWILLFKEGRAAAAR